MFFKIIVLKNFVNFTGTHLCWSHFLNEVSGMMACNFIKKRLQHRPFSEKFAKFPRTTFFYIENLPWGRYRARSFYLPQCPLTVPKLNFTLPLQNQISDLTNSLADSIIYRSNRLQMFLKISVLINFANFAGTHLCWSHFLNKVSGMKISTLAFY